jgi:hypothetical protein
MATLDYRCSTDDGYLAFELHVDGQPLALLVRYSSGTAIPYWIIHGDLPTFPPRGSQADPTVRIVAVCSCGEYGCGHVRCRVVQEGNEVVFRDFKLTYGDSADVQFYFSTEHYRAVVQEIATLANQQRDRWKRTVL